MGSDEKYMRRCLELAALASGHTAPNPMVGSVLVHRGRIIGEGYHQLYGQAHAEANAIRSVQDRGLLKDATLYVNLEPCSHHGNTPPCSELIVQHQVPRVVIGTVDPSSRVSGRGISILKAGGCQVQTGVLEADCRFLNRRFFTFHQQQRPYVVLKWARTADGFIDKIRQRGDPVQPNWITNDLSRHLVHKWRSQEQAILVGTHTALKDDPGLNVREWHGKDPLRLLIDRDLQIDASYKMVHDDLPLVIFTGKNRHKAKEQQLNHHRVEMVEMDFDQPLIPQILDYLHRKNILSLFVEGGSFTLSQFLKEELWDEARVFTGNRFFTAGVKAPEWPHFPATETKDLYETRLHVFYNK